jgi:hypothetical protein
VLYRLILIICIIVPVPAFLISVSQSARTFLISVPDPHVFGPPGSISISTNVRSTDPDPYCFVTFYDSSLKNDVNIASKSNKLNKLLTKIAGSGSGSQRYGSADLDSYQKVTDPQHCFLFNPSSLFQS